MFIGLKVLNLFPFLKWFYKLKKYILKLQQNTRESQFFWDILDFFCMFVKASFNWYVCSVDILYYGRDK